MPPDLSSLPPLRDVIAQYGLAARHSLGQHFLLDLNLTRRIARGAGPLDGRTVVEIGPGPGGLTRALLEADAQHVLAIEVDDRAVQALAPLAEAAEGRLTVLQADAMKLDLGAEAAARGLPLPVTVVSNLPYNVGTALLLRWLGHIETVAGMTLMFQREVADRLVAVPRSKAYGRLSIITQWLCRAERLFNVPAAAFTPPPKIASSVVRLTPHPAPVAPCVKRDLEAVTAAAFGQRRKMLRASLRSLGVPVDGLIAAAGVPETARAEELTVENFCAIARAYASAREQ